MKQEVKVKQYVRGQSKDTPVTVQYTVQYSLPYIEQSSVKYSLLVIVQYVIHYTLLYS